jgi:hypothetical protein
MIMSENDTPPSDSSEGLEVEVEIPSATEVKPRSPKFIAVSDIPKIIKILVGADKISHDEAIRRLNNMVAKGTLVFSPMFGTKRKGS